MTRRCYQMIVLALGMFFTTGAIAQAVKVIEKPTTKQYSSASQAFAQEVIRRLAQTMPPVKMRGVARVKFVVSGDGKPLKVRLIARARHQKINDAALRHIYGTLYPSPPANSSLDDRTFTVSYVYK